MSLSDLITARAIVLLQGKSARSPIHRLIPSSAMADSRGIPKAAKV